MNIIPMITSLPLSHTQQNEIKADAAKYLPEISAVLSRVPGQMLLILKTNDLLRGIEYSLNTHKSMSSFITMSRCCIQSLFAHRRNLCDGSQLCKARVGLSEPGLYSGTESAVKCGAGVSSLFPVNTGVRQGCVLAPSLFNTCMDWVLGKVVDQSDCGASLGNTKITDLVFADDAVIFAESLEVLVMALEALHEEAKPLGLEVSWLKTKVQVFGSLLDETVQSVHACGEDIARSWKVLHTLVAQSIMTAGHVKKSYGGLA
ncbi:putative aarF domain-containing protein kinase 1 [Chionoecetes opilio]|uniref:Putative aarF domain-containing protein kinase 1 n=1 Tax=Chionoecetes opilio TaxID=41210 RepID=A0A8J5CUS2_CHIOP|nr:putative aarF domain-containing protein kinase 1 [Chionoecetes opilio]